MKSSLVVALMALSCFPLAAQQLGRPEPPDGMPLPVRTLHEKGTLFFDEQDEVIWGRGDDFKASFSTGTVPVQRRHQLPVLTHTIAN